MSHFGFAGRPAAQLHSKRHAIALRSSADLGCRITFAPDREEIRIALTRVLDSSAFIGCARLKAFLNFVVESVLAGRTRFLKAYTIGVEALERNTNFNPTTDAIVRVEATRLRAALARYYDREGSADPVLISMPVGSYVPRFRWNECRSDARGVPVASNSDMLAECRRLQRLLAEAAKSRTALRDAIDDLRAAVVTCRSTLAEAKATLSETGRNAVHGSERPL
jgi:hypothetical protein